MKSLKNKFPFLQNTQNVLIVSLAMIALLHILEQIMTFQYVGESINWALVVPFVFFLLALIFGISRKYHWAEILTLLISIGGFVGSFIYLFNFFINNQNKDVPEIVFYTIYPLNLAFCFFIFILIFKIRFARSKKMTEEFEKYL